MTQNDKRLVAAASKLSPIDWPKINPEAAESEEAREELERLQSRLYHFEEMMLNA